MRFLCGGLLVCIALTFLPVVSFAQEEENFSGAVSFTNPMVIYPDSDYDFSFEVRNTTTPGDVRRWIDTVEIYMPSPGYEVISTGLSSPNPIHPDGTWEVGSERDTENTWVITWLYFGAASSAGFGDIDEGNSLEFGFTALTDEDASDGFDWRLIADSGEIDTGTAYIGEPDDDDGGGGDDDDGGIPDSDDEDGLDPSHPAEGDEGCGC